MLEFVSHVASLRRKERNTQYAYIHDHIAHFHMALFRAFRRYRPYGGPQVELLHLRFCGALDVLRIRRFGKRRHFNEEVCRGKAFCSVFLFTEVLLLCIKIFLPLCEECDNFLEALFWRFVAIVSIISFVFVSWNTVADVAPFLS